MNVIASWLIALNRRYYLWAFWKLSKETPRNPHHGPMGDHDGWPHNVGWKERQLWTWQLRSHFQHWQPWASEMQRLTQRYSKINRALHRYQQMGAAA